MFWVPSSNYNENLLLKGFPLVHLRIQVAKDAQ